MRHISLVITLLLGFSTSDVLGHEVLGPVQVNQILKSIQQSRTVLDGTASASEKEEALFKMGADAYALMKLINSDLREHGAENKGLIDLAIGRCKTMGVNIQPVAGGEFYVYDFEAFIAYRKLAPRGRYIPDVRFALIEKSSYDKHAGQRTPELLLKQIEEKTQLLKEFPKLTRRADLEMFLILDYLELHSFYLASNPAKSNQYKDLALERCRWVIDNYPDTDAANFARNLLLKFGL